MMPVLLSTVTFVATMVAVWVVGAMAYRWGWVVLPRNDRWHRRPVARFGGVAIAFGFVAGFALLWAFDRAVPLPPLLLPLLAGAAVAFAVGLVDDIVAMKPSTKLIGQIVAASIPITAGLLFSLTPWHLLNVLVSFVWFIGIMNAVNLSDNMDGLAAGVTILSGSSLAAIWVMSHGLRPTDFSLGVLVVFLSAIAGFLVFNRPPASIFMGDAGSLFLGYMLAGLALPSQLNGKLGIESATLSLLVPVAVLIVPIFDTTLVTFSRIWNGRSAAAGGTDHSSHRLVGLGFSEPVAVAILYALAAIGGAIAVAMHRWPAGSLMLAALYALLLVGIGLYLGRVRVYREPEGSASAAWTPLVSTILYKRRVAEVVLDAVFIAVTYYAAYALRFEGALALQSARYVASLPIIIAAGLLGLYAVGVYRGIWQLLTVSDLPRYALGVGLGTSIGVAVLAVLYHFTDYSRAVFVIFSLLLFLFVIGSRLAFVLVDDMLHRAKRTASRSVLVFGAGRAGRLLLQECDRNPEYADCRVVGFIDDDAGKHGLLLGGVQILDARSIGVLISDGALRAEELWISSHKIPDARCEEVRFAFEQASGRPFIVRRLAPWPAFRSSNDR